LNRILGLDYGKVRIGIALSDQSLTIAFGREYIPNDKNTLDKIKSIIENENVTTIVLGYPVNLKGGKSMQTIDVDNFFSRMKDYFNDENVTIVKWDERFTSKMAADSLIESGMKKKKRRDKGNIDIVSAAIMLQSYLDNLKINPERKT